MAVGPQAEQLQKGGEVEASPEGAHHSSRISANKVSVRPSLGLHPAALPQLLCGWHSR